MNRKILIGVLILFSTVASAQYHDLIVTNTGDSIACNILEVNDSTIIYKLKLANQKMQTGEFLKNISKYEYNVISKGIYIYKPGTSYIEKWFPVEYPVNSKTYLPANLKNASTQELEYYRYKALKKQKNGKALTFIGLGSCVVGGGMFAVGQNEGGWGGIGTMGGGVILAATGLINTIIGLSINSTGKNRVKQIDSMEKSAFNNRMKFELNTYINYDEVLYSQQTGIQLKVCF